MAQVVVGENEGIESALRRLKRQVPRAGILQDVRKNQHFETPKKRQSVKQVPVVVGVVVAN